MVIGLRTKNTRTPSVQVDYLIHIEEIKPWPPSQSLRSLRSVLIQWENGERSSGSTKAVVPSIGSIEFNESFRLHVTLYRDMSTRAGDADTFQKNCLELNLYEPRRDKTVKGQLLGTAIVDLGDYGVVGDKLRVDVPLNCKRNFRNTEQPILSLEIQRAVKGRIGSSARESLSKEVSLDKNSVESVSALMIEEYAEEAETASFTDDDISSHSSLTASSSAYESIRDLPPQNEKDSDKMAYSVGENEKEASLSKGLLNSSNMASRIAPQESLKGSSSCSSSVDLSSDQGSPVHGHVSVPDFPQKVHENVDNCEIAVKGEFQHNGEEATTADDIYDSSTDDKDEKRHQENGWQKQNLEEKRQSTEDEPDKIVSRGSAIRQVPLESDTFSSNRGNFLKIDQLKHVRSVRSPVETCRSGSMSTNQHEVSERKDAKMHSKNPRDSVLDGKVQQLEHRITMLEGELREAAATEAALYSVVAEHGSSMSKVHAPARRLSRLYLYACKESSGGRKASAARSAVSGLVLVAKACGNDVPRLTFWLSNSVVLRAIICQAMGDVELQLSAGADLERNGGSSGNENRRRSSPLKWKELSPSKEEGKSGMYDSLSDWDDSRVFISALEKIEGWIFSRIVESIWWQTLTPHMQSSAAKENHCAAGSGSKKTYGRASSSIDQDQGNFSLELWKKAFKEACERLCPLRGGGHECGCLPVLTRLIMEQCVARLDVAMFNAILREYADDIPTDPVSDPISDCKVLPIPAGKTSFGAGALLKVAIGNWSRWLTDLFGMDDDDPHEDEEYRNDQKDSSFKPFHLLRALSDLMMLPKDMLLSRSIRKEVCPAFGAPLIKRVVDNFVPDEFCPDPIPDCVLVALESENDLEADEENVANFPCAAAPIAYSPPSVGEITGEVGRHDKLRRSGSSVLRKSYTSDDELDELNLPLASIFIDGSTAKPQTKRGNWVTNEKEDECKNGVRYQLLREVWMKSDH